MINISVILFNVKSNKYHVRELRVMGVYSKKIYFLPYYFQNNYQILNLLSMIVIKNTSSTQISDINFVTY